MGKQVGTFFTRNYRVLVLLAVIAGLIGFGTVAWNASASNRQNAPSSVLTTATSVAPAKKVAFEGEEGEIQSPIPTDRVEGQDDFLNYDIRDDPPDTTHYIRPIENADRIALPEAPSVVQSVVVDAVVSNTDPNLTNTDTAGDGETSIAINPQNPNEIVMTAFSGGWGANSPWWHSVDGGATWTEQFTVPVPPGAAGSGGCPCDQAVDYGRGNRLAGTFMTGGTGTTDVYSGITTNVTQSASFNYFLTAGNAQRSNTVATSFGTADQPWLLVNPAPGNPAQDNTYVAYDDFSTNPPTMQVSVAAGTNPPNFNLDVSPGVGGSGVNPGHRLAENPTNGTMYSLFQLATGGDDTFRNLQYWLNRSTDGGATWTLNGNANGIIVASADSTQPRTKFGTVNALLGGVDHAAVDPATGDVYYVYGNRDSGTGNNRLAIRRITGGNGVVTVGPEVFVNGQVQSAIPSVAVNSDGVVGVFYYTYNGIVGGFPQFTARVAFSTDQGTTFSTDVALHTFASSATDNGNNRQRVLGDYMQMKAVGRTFFGSYTGNGAQFGRPVSNHDPIFFKIALEQSTSTSNIVSSDSTTVFGEPVSFTATITSPDGIPTGTVDFLDGVTPIAGCQDVALLAGVAQCQNVTSLPTGTRTINVNYSGDVAFNASTDSVIQTVSKSPSTTTITSDDPDPSVFGQTFPVTFTVVAAPPGAGTPTGNVIVTASGGPETCTGTVAAGTCNIKLSGVGIRTLTATYQSDANFLSSSDTETHQVDKANTTTTVTAVPASPSTFGQSVTFTATIAIQAPGAGPPNPTGTVSFNIDGILYCVNTPINASLQATCTQAGLPALPAGLRDVVALYSGDGNYNGSVGDINYTVNKANTTTSIISDLPDPSLVNQPYTVTWTVVPTPVQVNSGTPTGTVTVDGGAGGGSCSAPVASGSCQLTPTTVGVKTIQATYSGDANFNGSVSTTTTHSVNLQITGTVRRGPALTPVLGEPVFLAGCGAFSTSTNAAGVYSFTGAFTGTCRVFPNSPLSEPYERAYPAVATNITNADFVIYSSAADFPRKISFPTQYVAPGVQGSMPVIMQSLDNESSVAFSFTYDINPFSQPPVVVCGANAPGCTITNDTSIFGRVGFTVTPAAGGFSRPDGTPLDGPEAAGPKEIAKINFISVGTNLPNTDFGVPQGTPTAFSIVEKVTNNPLTAVFVTPARVVFAQGIEGDVAGRNAGSGAFEPADVVQMRRFISGIDTAVATHNEYQRADTAPAITKGDGNLNATDLVQVRRYVAGLDASVPSGGSGTPIPAPIAPPAIERQSGEFSEITIGDANVLNKSRVNVPVTFRANGSEAAVSFTIRYDAKRFADPTVELAAGLPDGVTLTANTKEPGAIRILVDATTALAFASQEATAFIDLGFNVRDAAASGDSFIEVEGLVFSDAGANEVASRGSRGKISVVGSNSEDTGAKLGGEVQLDRVDLVEEWLDGSFAILRPRLEGEASVPVVVPNRQKKQ